MNGLPAWRDLALATAHEAGQLLTTSASRRIESETDDDVKLQADADTETLVRQRLETSGLPIIGEELGGDAALLNADKPYWIVDPLDGTYNYLRRQPCTCVSIGLWRGQEPLLGVLRDFTADKTYLGIPGEGTTVNGRRIHPQWATRSTDACLMTGFPAAADKTGPAMEAFLREAARYKKIRMIGSAALALAYVAEGVADTYHESATNLWDFAAGLALVKASGGSYRMVPTGRHPLSFDLWASAREEWTR